MRELLVAVIYYVGSWSAWKTLSRTSEEFLLSAVQIPMVGMVPLPRILHLQQTNGEGQGKKELILVSVINCLLHSQKLCLFFAGSAKKEH